MSTSFHQLTQSLSIQFSPLFGKFSLNSKGCIRLNLLVNYKRFTIGLQSSNILREQGCIAVKLQLFALFTQFHY